MDEDDDFQLDAHDIRIHCPFCGTEMVHHPNRLFLAEARCGAMIECGNCAEITSWSFTLSPFTLRQVPNEWGGHIECD